jgi:hypothetical protein
MPVKVTQKMIDAGDEAFDGAVFGVGAENWCGAEPHEVNAQFTRIFQAMHAAMLQETALWATGMPVPSLEDGYYIVEDKGERHVCFLSGGRWYVTGNE